MPCKRGFKITKVNHQLAKTAPTVNLEVILKDDIEIILSKEPCMRKGQIYGFVGAKITTLRIEGC